MSHRLILLLFCFCFCFCFNSTVWAQKSSPSNDSGYPAFSPLVQVSYFGETIWHPGLSLSYEQTFRPSFQKSTSSTSFSWGGQVAYFAHRQVHRSFWGQGRMGYHLFLGPRVRLGILVGLGLNRYSLASPAYEQQADGSFAQVFGKGGWQVVPSLGGEIILVGARGRGVFFRPWLLQPIPHGRSSLTVLVTEFGCTFPLTN